MPIFDCATAIIFDSAIIFDCATAIIFDSAIIFDCATAIIFESVSFSTAFSSPILRGGGGKIKVLHSTKKKKNKKIPLKKEEEKNQVGFFFFKLKGGLPGQSSCRTTQSCRHKALLSSSGPDSIEKDLAGPEARLTLVERFPDERRGCGAPPE